MKRSAHHGWGLDRLRDLIGPLDRNRANDLIRRLNNLDPELGLDFDLVVESARTLVSTLGLNGDHVLDEARGRASALGDSLLELAHAATDAREFASARGDVASHASELASARSELLDPQFLMLPRHQRLGHALWILVRTPALRWALRELSHRVER